MHTIRLLILTTLLFSLLSCSGSTEQEASETPVLAETAPPDFTPRKVADSLSFLWSYCTGDINADGLQDLVYIWNNANGGYLAYRTATQAEGIWPEVVVAAVPPTGGTFASGDLETGDMDGDGDIDILGVKHTGEWDGAGEAAELFWFENPDWTPHTIGTAPDAVKDISLADFDGNGLMDVATLTFDEGNLAVHLQQAGGEFLQTVNVNYPNLHEGMDIGDLDGDGDVDILANGIAFYNPGSDTQAPWSPEVIHDRWNSQEGDWSRNATKGFVQDIDGDGVSEVFISHSERAGYPVAWYQKAANGQWEEHIIADSLPACHTLQVYDFDLDGDLDILAGVNQARAVNIGHDYGMVNLYLNDGKFENWKLHQLIDESIYNGRVADFEGDGDMDLFRLPTHESTEVFLHINETR
ncbi:MAG: VCBS repeat-containing protein [Bacteroidota bacterium]